MKKQFVAVLSIAFCCFCATDGLAQLDRNERTRDYFQQQRHFRPSTAPSRGHGNPVTTLRFRTIDGTMNNLMHIYWGSTGNNLIRLSRAAYSDGISEPAGGTRLSAREISNLVASQTTEMPNRRHMTSMVWQWGQFLDHDIDLTHAAEPEEYFPIPVPLGDPFFDPFFTGNEYIDLFRSEYNTRYSPRQQRNSITAWIDGSNVYGSDDDTADSLREFQGGRMLVSDGNLLPVGDDGFFMAGDVRANEQLGLLSMHTLFVREHNRVARRIERQFPRLNDEQIYLRARREVIAVMQAITYNEFLPALLGPTLRPYTTYKPWRTPKIANEFSTASYRFGHSMLDCELLRLDNSGQPIGAGNILLRDAFFNPQELIDHGIDPYLKGLMQQQAQEIDNQLVDDVRNFLFGPPGAGGFDLASLNIQRGRDHGLPDYNTIRRAMGLAKVRGFAEITSDPDLQAALDEAYEGVVDNIDPWVGMLAEDHAPGASVGPTVRAVLKRQFEFLRDGDRFWYQRNLSRRDLQRIENTRLSNVIYRNSGVRRIQRNVFFMPRHQPPPP